MHDLRARRCPEKCLSHEANNVVSFNKLSFFIKEEASVTIAVPCYSQISMVFKHRLGGNSSVFRENRIGNAVGKRTVRFGEHGHEFDRQSGLEFVEDWARAHRCRNSSLTLNGFIFDGST